MNSAKPYIFGYFISAILTLVAFTLIYQHVTSHHQIFSHEFLKITVLVLAIAQFIAQLGFFLHLGSGAHRGWNLAIFSSALGLILIIVIGSLWIMNHLNYNMTPQQMDQYMINDGG